MLLLSAAFGCGDPIGSLFATAAVVLVGLCVVYARHELSPTVNRLEKDLEKLASSVGDLDAYVRSRTCTAPPPGERRDGGDRTMVMLEPRVHAAHTVRTRARKNEEERPTDDDSTSTNDDESREQKRESSVRLHAMQRERYSRIAFFDYSILALAYGDEIMHTVPRFSGLWRQQHQEQQQQQQQGRPVSLCPLMYVVSYMRSCINTKGANESVADDDDPFLPMITSSSSSSSSPLSDSNSDNENDNENKNDITRYREHKNEHQNERKNECESKNKNADASHVKKNGVNHRRRPIVVLELGYGKGASALRLAATFGDVEVWGIDTVEAHRDHAQRRARHLGLSDRVHFLLGDITNPPEEVWRRRYDVVFGVDSLCYCDDADKRERVLLLCRTVLRDGGKLVIVDGGRQRHSSSSSSSEEVTPLPLTAMRLSEAAFCIRATPSREDWVALATARCRPPPPRQQRRQQQQQQKRACPQRGASAASLVLGDLRLIEDVDLTEEASRFWAPWWKLARAVLHLTPPSWLAWLRGALPETFATFVAACMVSYALQHGVAAYGVLVFENRRRRKNKPSHVKKQTSMLSSKLPRRVPPPAAGLEESAASTLV